MESTTQAVRGEIDEEIDKFKDFAAALQSEGWEIDAILNILKSYLKSKLGNK